ncbi:hypothetical protein CAPI_00100 [Corynebacterium capitovis DSM 44611]|uniref:hypothetical protein n=1 Tax=Corynebacterium capitovis TaxID=131081 RepID=UPI000381E492|nr:hypothetical protein [Corynebacterium capitovis]WKD56608.1 hypothetical protein CAPI_00100 [Corynebacterium capitovis DSM 44611]
MTPLLTVRDLTLTKGATSYTFDAGTGLTLLKVARESGASTVSMAIAGRYKPVAGTIAVGDAETTRERFRSVALAGVTLIDSLERSVSVREAIREQVAWAQPFFSRVPKDILSHRLVEPWLEPLGLADLDPAVPVGDLHALDRLRLRVVLALISRRDARLLVVDDPDQLRSISLRDELLANLHDLSELIPVVVSSVNPDHAGIADAVIDLAHGKRATK